MARKRKISAIRMDKGSRLDVVSAEVAPGDAALVVGEREAYDYQPDYVRKVISHPLFGFFPRIFPARVRRTVTIFEGDGFPLVIDRGAKQSYRRPPMTEAQQREYVEDIGLTAKLAAYSQRAKKRSSGNQVIDISLGLAFIGLTAIFGYILVSNGGF